MKKALIIALVFPLLSCGVKKELATTQQENIELEKRLIELENQQAELEKQNLELYSKNQEYRRQIGILLRDQENRTKVENQNERIVAVDEIAPPPSSFETKPIPSEEKIFDFVEERAVFPGGDDQLYKFIQNNLKYPAEDKETRGTVFVKFVIEKDGSISNLKVVRGLGEAIDNEAIRIVKLMPKWTPGKQRGTPVRSRFVLPIKFIPN